MKKRRHHMRNIGAALVIAIDIVVIDRIFGEAGGEGVSVACFRRGGEAREKLSELFRLHDDPFRRTCQAATIFARRFVMISSASPMIRSISSLKVGMSWIRPATMPQLQAPASTSPCCMTRG